MPAGDTTRSAGPTLPVPRAAWVFLLCVALLGAAELAWHAVTVLIDPPTWLYEDYAADGAAYDDTYDAADDDPWADADYVPGDDEGWEESDDSHESLDDVSDSADDVSDSADDVADSADDVPDSDGDVAAAAADAPEGDTAVTAVDTAVDAIEEPVAPADVSSQIAVLRERIRERSEAERAQEAALAARLAADAEADDAEEAETPASATYTAPPLTVPWDYTLRQWLGVLVLLMLALGLGFVARRAAEMRYGFAALILSVVALVQLAGVLVWPHTTGAAFDIVRTLARASAHLSALAFVLIALTAKRRGWLLALLVIAVDVTASLNLAGRSRLSMILMEPSFAFALAAVAQWCIAAWIFVQQLRATNASAELPGGPYRQATLAGGSAFARHSATAAASVFGAWILTQMLTGPIGWRGLMELPDLGSYVVAADFAVAIMAAMQVRASLSKRERAHWMYAAGVLWIMALLGVLAVPQPGAASGIALSMVLVPLFLVCLSGMAAGFLLAAVYEGTLARLEGRPGPRKPGIPAVPMIVIGGLALRVASVVYNVDCVWVTAAIGVAAGLAVFIRVTNGFQETLRSEAPTTE